jgi:hypothetical protein
MNYFVCLLQVVGILWAGSKFDNTSAAFWQLILFSFLLFGYSVLIGIDYTNSQRDKE